MALTDPLRRYRERRDLDAAPDPGGDSGREPGDAPIFVVQEHDASSHHFDFRLEADGVLISWAVPNGPSTDPSDKRLAVHVDDHSLDYADFEGLIPDEQYGTGPVIVWDIGPYHHLTTDDHGELKSVRDAVADGHVKVWLEGSKIRGGYAFQHARVGGDDDNWLLIKLDDDGADARRNPTSTEPESAISGRTIDDLRSDEG